MLTALEIAEARLAAWEEELATMQLLVDEQRVVVDALRAAEEAPGGGDERDDPPERNGSHKGPAVPTVPIRKLAAPPPPPVSGTPDTTARIARALAGGPLKLGALVEAVGKSQPVVSGKLSAHSGTGCAERLRYFVRTHEGWGLTERGRKEFGV